MQRVFQHFAKGVETSRFVVQALAYLDALKNGHPTLCHFRTAATLRILVVSGSYSVRRDAGRRLRPQGNTRSVSSRKKNSGYQPANCTDFADRTTASTSRDEN
jgi:hypothetical protein